MQLDHPDGIHPNRDLAKPFRALVPVFFYFAAAGIATVMLGPLLPALIQRWHIQDAQAGTLFTASFVGQFCGAWFATRNLRASILYGSAITAAGCIAMAWVGFDAAHIALFCTGLGLGAGLTAGNVIAGTTVPAERARALGLQQHEPRAVALRALRDGRRARRDLHPQRQTIFNRVQALRQLL